MNKKKIAELGSIELQYQQNGMSHVQKISDLVKMVSFVIKNALFVDSSADKCQDDAPGMNIEEMNPVSKFPWDVPGIFSRAYSGIQLEYKINLDFLYRETCFNFLHFIPE